MSLELGRLRGQAGTTAARAGRLAGTEKLCWGLLTYRLGISATRVQRVLRDHLATPGSGTLPEASMRERLHHQPRLCMCVVRVCTFASLARGAAQLGGRGRAAWAPLPGLVVTMPGPGLDDLRDQKTHNIPAPESSNAGATSAPSQQDYMGTVDIKRYIAQEGSMSLEQSDGRTARVCCYGKG